MVDMAESDPKRVGGVSPRGREEIYLVATCVQDDVRIMCQRRRSRSDCPRCPQIPYDQARS